MVAAVPMPILPSEHRRAVTESFGVFVYSLVIFAFAIALHFAVKFCEEQNFPAYMTWPMWGVSVLAFYVDAYVTSLFIAMIAAQETKRFFASLRGKP